MFEKTDKYSLLENDATIEDFEDNKPTPKERKFSWVWLAVTISLLLNFALVVERFILKPKPECLERSEFAGLTWDVPIPWVHNTEYANTNLSEASELWEAIDFDSGFIALPNDYAQSKSLPPAQEFVWDTTKGIYVVNAYHSLHCLKSIHASLTEYSLGRTQSYPLEHVTHCIDSLRREVLCTADDTPRWTSRTADPESGVGQNRQCRDWSKLEEWVAKYNSCYNRIDEEASKGPEIERYKFCPPGSPYREVMKAYFSRVLHKEVD